MRNLLRAVTRWDFLPADPMPYSNPSKRREYARAYKKANRDKVRAWSTEDGVAYGRYVQAV